MGHLQLPDVGDSRLHLRLYGPPQLPDDPDPRRLHAHAEGSLSLPRRKHVLHRFRSLGYSRS